MRTTGLLIGAIALMVLALASCQQAQVDQALDRSSAEILVPEGLWRQSFDFSAPAGSTDLYTFRWNFSPGATDVVVGWQVSATSEYERANDLVVEALRAARDDTCTAVDDQTNLALCLYDAEFARDGVNAYLVRPMEGQVLVVDYINLDGDRLTYNPEALEAEFINASFERVPVDVASDAYLDTSN